MAKSGNAKCGHRAISGKPRKKSFCQGGSGLPKTHALVGLDRVRGRETVARRDESQLSSRKGLVTKPQTHQSLEDFFSKA